MVERRILILFLRVRLLMFAFAVNFIVACALRCHPQLHIPIHMWPCRHLHDKCRWHRKHKTERNHDAQTTATEVKKKTERISVLCCFWVHSPSPDESEKFRCLFILKKLQFYILPQRISSQRQTVCCAGISVCFFRLIWFWFAPFTIPSAHTMIAKKM